MINLLTRLNNMLIASKTNLSILNGVARWMINHLIPPAQVREIGVLFCLINNVHNRFVVCWSSTKWIFLKREPYHLIFYWICHLEQKSDLQDLLSNLGDPSHYVQGLNMKGFPLLRHKAEQYHQLCIKSRLNEKGDIIKLAWIYCMMHLCPVLESTS